MRRAQVAFVLLAALTGAVYLAMTLVTLPHLREAAGGLAPFDLRPGGYSAAQARAFLDALDAPARQYYLSVQQRLDLVFPALEAVTLIFAFRALATGWLAVGLSVMAGLGAVFDYLENHAVAALLRADTVTDDMIVRASGWTVLKSVAVTLSLTALALLTLRAVYFRMRR
ncbi:hypothetical protein [Thioclava pacifica]|uniref:Uncharacterized protein n=1 Tax=Thioclava pacifica DSM 10166 TaxID=1353537 RepID=A0A074JLG3_9RHOB|nr:hypothetical protein [Thioclava pacifica]KEO56433.1 hypothetical protein TP2_02570 [Thioclava pacifica DSM 10166]